MSNEEAVLDLYKQISECMDTIHSMQKSMSILIDVVAKKEDKKL